MIGGRVGGSTHRQCQRELSPAPVRVVEEVSCIAIMTKMSSRKSSPDSLPICQSSYMLNQHAQRTVHASTETRRASDIRSKAAHFLAFSYSALEPPRYRA